MTFVEMQLGIQESIKIDASIEEVWRVFSQLERWREWNPVYTNVTQLTGEPWLVGSTFGFTVKPWWSTTNVKATIVESSPPERVVWAVQQLGVWGEHTCRFEQQGEGTLAVSHEIFGGPMRFLMPLFAPSWQIRRMFARWLKALKTEVEQRR